MRRTPGASSISARYSLRGETSSRMRRLARIAMAAQRFGKLRHTYLEGQRITLESAATATAMTV